MKLRRARDAGVRLLACTIFAVVTFILAVDSAEAGPLQDASEFTVRIRTSIEHPFAEDDPGTTFGAGFVIDRTNGWILTNAHVAGRGNSTIEIAFKNKSYTEATPIYVVLGIGFQRVVGRGSTGVIARRSDKPIKGAGSRHKGGKAQGLAGRRIALAVRVHRRPVEHLWLRICGVFCHDAEHIFLRPIMQDYWT